MPLLAELLAALPPPIGREKEAGKLQNGSSRLKVWFPE